MADAPASAGGAPADGGAPAGAAAPLPAPANTAAHAAARGAAPPAGPPVPAAINRKERQILRKHFGIKVGKNADLAEVGAKYREKGEERKTEVKALRAEVPALKGRLTHAEALIKTHAEAALKTLPEAAQTTIK